VTVQAFVAQFAVEALDITILNGFAGPDKVELDPSLIGPRVQSTAAKFRAVIDGDCVRQTSSAGQPIEALHDPSSGQRESRFKQRAFPTELIHNGQDPERSAVGQAV